MNDLAALVLLLNKVIAGAELTEKDIRLVKWKCDDPIVGAAANDTWLALRRFSDDADIRTRDKEYEASLREGLRAHAQELAALQRGEDPYRRRASWLHRLLWRLGIVK